MFSFIASVQAAGTAVTIRRVCVPTDLTLLQQLFAKEFAGGATRSGIGIDTLREIYAGIALSPNADAYLALAGDEALFLFEAHQARYCDTPPGLIVNEGDWMVDLFMIRQPLMENTLYLAALKTCIEQCFHQPAISQLLIIQTYSEQYRWIKELLEQLSFRRWKEGSLAAGKEIYRLVRATQ